MGGAPGRVEQRRRSTSDGEAKKEATPVDLGSGGREKPPKQKFGGLPEGPCE